MAVRGDVRVYIIVYCEQKFLSGINPIEQTNKTTAHIRFEMFLVKRRRENGEESENR